VSPGASSGPSRGGRLLLVHAHPDDETLATGATLARYAAEGAGVTLVTCTLGQEGEVIPPELRHLESARDDALGPLRERELAAAMAALGVCDFRLLAGGRWRDSGMAWLAPGIAGEGADVHPDAFVRADVEEAAAELARVVREVRPHVVVTYDPEGGYGHPDHVHAHRVTMRAVELAEAPGSAGTDVDGRAPGWTVPRLCWVQVRRSWAEAERQCVLRAASDGTLPAPLTVPDDGAGFPPTVVADELVGCVVDASVHREAIVRALQAHATQVRVLPPWYGLSNDVAHVLTTVEGFRVARGQPWPDGGTADDLFAGLDLSA
jgi:N-acetyl-1-D-myo-inositol-2-amino-2-deoxy-alpha-D-glucopyranoside deacetylase